MRHSGIRNALFDALLLGLLLAALLLITRVEGYFASDVAPLVQAAIFTSVALLLTASALRHGLARGSHLAYTDELTGLDNRRSFTEELASHGSEFRHGRQTAALLLLDLDRFKVVNDTLGHPAGDELLKVVAGRLRACVPPEAFVARLGGDEFAIIARVRADHEALMLAEDALRALNQPVLVNGHEIWPNASVGIAVQGPLHLPPGELFSRADVALYQAKGRGKGRAMLFDSNVPLPSVNKLSMESELHIALQEGQFEMLYQPIVNLRDCRIVGAEALLRWNHPVLGLLTPDAFLSLAEEIGIGQSLGRWIVAEVSEQSRIWRQLFGDTLSVSINVSASAFQSVDFVYSVGRIVRDSGAPINALNFEVAESSLTSDDTTAQSNLEELRKMGFKVAIDDFGVGLSSLNYLQTNRMDVLKLDPAFVHSEDENLRTFRIVHSIVELAHSLSMTVVAEAIETVEQYHRMRQAGCDYGQGYYFAHPMPAHYLTELLANGLGTLPVEDGVKRRRRSRPWNRPVPGDADFPLHNLPEQRGA